MIEIIQNILRNNFYEVDGMQELRTIIKNISEKEECVKEIRKEISKQRKNIEEKFTMHKNFLSTIFRSNLEKNVDYNQMILELDRAFNIKHIYKDSGNKNSKMGIIFISTSFKDYDKGIEWCSINAFMFNEGAIVKNIVKISSDTTENFEFENNIISLDELADADYEMNNELQEQKNEEYYKSLYNWENDEIDDYSFLYDVILQKNNNFFEIFDIEGEKIEGVIENNDFLRVYKLFDHVTVPDSYSGEDFTFEESELYQDGILLEVNPQCIVPIGVGYVRVNLTSEARLELNVSRHELNNSREVIDKWLKNIGSIIQKKVAEHCIQVLRDNNLDFKIQDLLSKDAGDIFEEECLLSMQDILRKL